MNILRIIASMDPACGGPCQGIRNSIPELYKLGVQSEVVCLDDPSSHFIGEDRFPIHALGPRSGKWSYSPNLIAWFHANLSRFDIVIVHGLWLYHSYAISKVMRQLKEELSSNRKIPKLYIMPHGMLDPYFQRVTDRKIKAIRNWVYWKFIEGRVVNEADGILFTCETELQLARMSFRPYRPKIEAIVGYGVPKPPTKTSAMCEAFHEKCPEIGKNPFLLFLGRVHEKKGIDMLVQAYISLKRNTHVAEIEVPKLVIAGPNLDSRFGKKMQKLTSSTSDLHSSIFFTGMLSGDAKWGAYYNCSAFVLPSHQENFGIAVVEAMACGKPVLISDQVNIWREIESEGGGFVSSDSVEGTQQMLKFWMESSSKEKQIMGLKALKTYKKKFTNERAAKQFLRITSL